jgi:SAM-dependent methyltransferase
MTTQADTPTLKDRHRATWAAGDYGQVADRLVLPLGPVVVARTSIGREDEVLDVAAGTGNAAIPAAATGARVVGLDLTPELLDVARRRSREAGVEVEWVEGDAEDLPFANDSFDAVVSTLGIQFAPHHEQVAAELARVCRPGGRIGLCNWTPEGYIGRFFTTMAPYMPPPPEGVSPPPLWGDEGHVERLLGGAGLRLAFERRTVDFRHDSPGAFVDFMATRYGPLVKARELLTTQGRWSDLRADLVALSAEMDTAPAGSFLVPSEYLIVIGRMP